MSHSEANLESLDGILPPGPRSERDPGSSRTRGGAGVVVGGDTDAWKAARGEIGAKREGGEAEGDEEGPDRLKNKITSECLQRKEVQQRQSQS